MWTCLYVHFGDMTIFYVADEFYNIIKFKKEWLNSRKNDH